jgi:hypothetical protein
MQHEITIQNPTFTIQNFLFSAEPLSSESAAEAEPPHFFIPTRKSKEEGLWNTSKSSSKQMASKLLPISRIGWKLLFLRCWQPNP